MFLCDAVLKLSVSQLVSQSGLMGNNNYTPVSTGMTL